MKLTLNAQGCISKKMKVPRGAARAARRALCSHYAVLRSEKSVRKLLGFSDTLYTTEIRVFTLDAEEALKKVLAQ